MSYGLLSLSGQFWPPSLFLPVSPTHGPPHFRRMYPDKWESRCARGPLGRVHLRRRTRRRMRNEPGSGARLRGQATRSSNGEKWRGKGGWRGDGPVCKFVPTSFRVERKRRVNPRKIEGKREGGGRGGEFVEPRSLKIWRKSYFL